MNDLHMVPDGAILIRDALIDEIGPGRRIENLAAARGAREINATGKIVMPAFVDPDAALASPGRMADGGTEADIRRMSRRRLKAQALVVAAELARSGTTTVGANTVFAPDLPNAMKALQVNQAVQLNPLRVRSVFSLPPGELSVPASGDVLPKTVVNRLEAVSRMKLSSLLEIDASIAPLSVATAVAAVASATGYATRFRVAGQPSIEMLNLACFAGAIALLPDLPYRGSASRELADMGCVQVLSAMRIMTAGYENARAAIDDGTPLALASGYRSDSLNSLNPQFRMYLAENWLGMSTEEGIVASTYNAAYALRFSHLTGSLEPGKSADICIMDLDNYHELARPSGPADTNLVMRAGKIIYERGNPPTGQRQAFPQ